MAGRISRVAIVSFSDKDITGRKAACIFDVARNQNPGPYIVFPVKSTRACGMFRRISLYLCSFNVDFIPKPAHAARIFSVMPDFKRHSSFFRTHGIGGEHSRFSVVVGMGMGDQIGIGLRMLSNRPGSINRKGAQVSGFVPEPKRDMRFKSPARITLSERQHTKINQFFRNHANP